MPTKNLSQRQINKLLEAFDEIHPKIQKENPLDRTLTGYFRKNPKFGSKDRRRVSASIFGYYRWYGWLSQIPEDKRSLALLLGYLLDDNAMSGFVIDWIELLQQTDSLLEKFSQKEPIQLKDKSVLIANYVSKSSIAALMPDFLGIIEPSIIAVNQQRAPIWVRVLDWAFDEFILFLEQRGVGFETSEIVNGAIKLEKSVNLFESKVFKKGGVEVQDLSSQIVGLICHPQKEDIWWDVCSGSGGKALHLASLMDGDGRVIATDIREQAIQECKKRSQWGQWNNIKSIHWDGNKIPNFSRTPNAILVDAPCSCSGTWRRSPDLRWNLKPERILEFAKIQLKILETVAPVLRKGGKLLYATCSHLSQENEMVVKQFLSSHSEYGILWEESKWDFLEKSEHGYNLGPPLVDGNYMFLSSMVRK